MSRTTIDIHVLQTVPPSNVNRDDTGSPKTAIYGGVRRARVSSQAWKRATRTGFAGLIDPTDLGVRTKKVVDLVADHISVQAPELADEAADLAVTVLTAAGITVTSPRARRGETPGTAEVGYLLFLSVRQAQQLAELAIEAHNTGIPTSKKAAKNAADTGHGIDVALFGRMVADATDLNVDAAAQVAHAISVHAVDNEYDYFTAVDDKAPEDNAGAGMIGTVEFNSSTLYRYATVNVDALHKTLGNTAATALATSAFIRSFVTSMPTGKQNTFANRTLPDAVVVTIGDGQPVNLVGAFEEALVASSGATRLSDAARRLTEHSQEIDEAFGSSAVATFVVHVGQSTASLTALGARVSFDALLAGVAAAVAQRLPATT